MTDQMTEQRDHSGAASVSALATNLRVALGLLTRRLREESQIGDFSWSQLKVLTRLERDGPATVTTLATAEGVRSQSMGATIASLKAAGFVTGEPDPSDGRQTLLSLTDAYREAIRNSRAAREDWLSRAIDAKLSPTEIGQLAEMLPLLGRLLEP